MARIMDGRSPYKGDSDDEDEDPEEVVSEEAGTKKPLAERVAGWTSEAIQKVEDSAPLVGNIAKEGGKKAVSVAEGIGTAAAGRVESLIGSLPARRRGGADEEPETERPEAEDPIEDDYDDCGRAIDPELEDAEAGTKNKNPNKNLESIVGEQMAMILDGVEAGVQRIEGPAKRVEEAVGKCVVEPVSRTLDSSQVSDRMQQMATSIGGLCKPVGDVATRIERSVTSFVEDKVSPHLGSVMGPARPPQRHKAH